MPELFRSLSVKTSLRFMALRIRFAASSSVSKRTGAVCADPRRRAPRCQKEGRARLLPRLEDNGRKLVAAYRALVEAVRQGDSISPAAEWLLDNFSHRRRAVARDS